MDGPSSTVLTHYGVRGMHWGVRRGTPKVDIRSHDVQRVDAAKRTIRKSGTKAVSNADLQAVVTRMNLERQYAQLNPPLLSKKNMQALDGVLNIVGKKRVKDVVLKGMTKAIKVALL